MPQFDDNAQTAATQKRFSVPMRGSPETLLRALFWNRNESRELCWIYGRGGWQMHRRADNPVP